MVTVSGAFEDSSTSIAEPSNARADATTGVQHCVFCQDTDWEWFRYLGAAPPGASRTLPQFVVTCGNLRNVRLEEVDAVRELAGRQRAARYCWTSLSCPSGSVGRAAHGPGATV